MTTHPDAPVVVFGATGAQGGPVAARLLAAGRPVRAVARTPEHLEPLATAGAEPHPLDLADAEAVERVLTGAGGAFVHLPFVPVEDLVRVWAGNVAAGLTSAGVPLAVFTTSGPVASERTGVATFDAHRVAVEVLEAAAAPVVVLEPAIYLDNLTAPFSAPGVAAGELRYPPFPSDLAMPFVSLDDQAVAALAALERPDLAGRRLPIGERLTGARLAAGLADGLGRPVRHVPMTPRELGDAVRPFLGDQVGDVLTADYALLADRPATLRLDGDPQASHAELGTPTTPVAQWARAQAWATAGAAA